MVDLFVIETDIIVSRQQTLFQQATNKKATCDSQQNLFLLNSWIPVQQ
jgi:hypothetical protein